MRILAWAALIVVEIVFVFFVVDAVLHCLDSVLERHACSGAWYCLPFHHLRLRLKPKGDL